MTGPSDRPAPRCPRYATLDMWRGAACIGVIVYHATLYSSILRGGGPAWDAGPAALIGWLASHGDLGVPVFFVISGYCIAAAADGARRRPRPARGYFRRRFRRIYPPLWAAMLLSVVLHVAVDSVLLPGVMSRGPWPQPHPWWYSAWQWAGNLTLTETWRPYLIGGPRGHFPTQAWTLCYEEQFYAVMGALLVIAPRRLFGGAAIVTLLAAAAFIAAGRAGVEIEGWFFDGNWFTFAAGLLVYVVLNYGTRLRGLATGWLLLLSVPAAFLAAGLHLAAGLCFAALLVFVHPLDARINGARVLQPLVPCGTMCYSLYLVHQPLVRGVARLMYELGATSLEATLLFTVPAALAVSLTVGRAFFVVVERRFLNTPVPARMAPQPLPCAAVSA